MEQPREPGNLLRRAETCQVSTVGLCCNSSLIPALQDRVGQRSAVDVGVQLA